MRRAMLPSASEVQISGSPLREEENASWLPLGDHAFTAALTALGVTRREGEVLGWVATGRSNREVAELLEVSERTVQKHLQRCFAKLGARSRAQAIARARGLVAV